MEAGVLDRKFFSHQCFPQIYSMIVCLRMFRSFKNSGVCRCERTKIFKELGCKAKGLVNKGSRNGPSEAGVLASKFLGWRCARLPARGRRIRAVLM